MRKKHGMRGSKEYNSWRGMRERCRNPNNKAYVNYGARGIKVCEAWQDSFQKFYSDMGPRPNGMSLDRIDNNGNYSLDNCRWATRQIQTFNSRKHKNTVSKYTGVVFMKDRGKWHARIGLNGKHIHLGQFNSQEAAASARSEYYSSFIKPLLAIK